LLIVRIGLLRRKVQGEKKLTGGGGVDYVLKTVGGWERNNASGAFAEGGDVRF